MTDGFSPLTVAEYAAQAALTDQRSVGGSLAFPLLGLFGETGSLLSEAKKKQRDRASYLGYASAVVEELGDVLWYLATVASRASFPLTDVFKAADPERLRDTADPITLAMLQPPIMPHRDGPTAEFEKTLLRLAGSVGALVTEWSAPQAQESALSIDRLAAIAANLIQAADEAGITLEAAAVKNLRKIESRWPRVRRYPVPLDEDAAPEEKLPRHLTIEIFERPVRAQTYVFQRCNGVNIGDRLTDNAMAPDDYRFHDVFHYAYVAVLGWSPVVRALFRLKRKSSPQIDDAQDGARATLIEEGITTWIFGQAIELDLFAGIDAGGLPFDLLKHVQQFVAGYEPEHSPLWVWEDAILQGYAAFRYLRKHRRGLVKIDMNQHKLTIGPLP